MPLAVRKLESIAEQPVAWVSALSVPAKTTALFTRQLAVMYRAGIPLTKAVKALSHQSESLALGYVLLGVTWQLRRGDSLSQALRAYPQVFPAVYTALVREGESIGQLDVSLDKAAQFLEDDDRLIKTARGALYYPMFVLIVGILGGFGCLHFLAPILAELVADVKSIPWPTEVLLALVSVATNPWSVAGILLSVVLLTIVTRKALSTRSGQFRRDKFLLKVPILGTLIRQIVLCRIARTLAASIKSGVQLSLILELCAEVSGNRVFEQDLLKARAALINGIPLEKYLHKKKKLYTPIFVAMVAVGHETGNLEKVAEKLAGILETSSWASVNVFLALLQPAIMGVLGLFVGFVGLATLLPIYELL